MLPECASVLLISDGTMSIIRNVDVSKFYHELFCLKREFHISNLPELHAIRVVGRANSDKKNKVAEVHLFNPEGEMFVLEMWNRDATDGVKYLWELLGDEEEVLLRFQDLDPNSSRDSREPSFKLSPATSFQQEFKPYPDRQRIYNRNAISERFCPLSKQCTRIKACDQIQLMNGKTPMRDICLWDQTVQRQEEDDDPDELQQLIYSAMAISPLGKRAGGGEVSTQADKGNRVTFDKLDMIETPFKKPKGRSSSSTNRSSSTSSGGRKKETKPVVDGTDAEMTTDQDNSGGNNSPSSSTDKMDTGTEGAQEDHLKMVRTDASNTS